MLREWWENDENGCTDMRSLDLTCSVLPLMKRDGQIFITQPVPERKSSPRCCWWKPEPLSHWGPFRRNILPWWPSSSPCAPNLFNVDWDDWNSCELWVTKNSEPVKVSNVTALTDQRQTDMDWHGVGWRVLLPGWSTLRRSILDSSPRRTESTGRIWIAWSAWVVWVAWGSKRWVLP